MRNFSKIAAATFSALALTSIAHAQPAAQSTPSPKPPSMKLNTFVRGVYWPFERTRYTADDAGMELWAFSEKVLSDLKNRYHCDLIWVVNSSNADAVKLAGIAEKYGIGVVPVTNAIYDYRGVRTQKAANAIAEKTVAVLGGAPGVAGYVLLDEPKRGEVDILEATRAALAEKDPNRPALVVSMLRQTEAVARRTKLPFLVSDPYPFFGPKSPNGPNTPAISRRYYLDATRRTVAMANETGKTPWMMPQIFSDPWGDWHYDAKWNAVAEPGAHSHWRMPTTGETRWQIWQAVGAGAKGVVFYVLFPTPNPRRSAQDSKEMKGYRIQKPQPDWLLFKTETPLNVGTGILRNDGSSTPQAETMGETFGALEPHRVLLGRLQSALPIAFADAPFRATTFRDPQDGKTYVVVVNDNTDDTLTGKLRLLPTTKSVRDVISGATISTQTNAANLSELVLKIEAGGGALLVLDDENLALQTYAEDFAIQISAGKFERVQKVLIPEAWGMGYRIAVKTQADAPTVGPQQGAADVVNPAATGAGGGELEYAMSEVAADWGMKGRLYLIYSGSKNADKAGVEVSVSTDGKDFQRLSLDEFNQPIAIAPRSAHLRFSLLDESATLDGWKLIAVP